MRLHWIAATFLLGFIIVLDPTHTPAQFPGGKGGDGGGGKGGKGKKDRGGDFGGGAFPGGGGRDFTKGGGAFPAPGGAFPAPSGAFPQPGGGPGRGMGGDPNAMWDRMAQGKDSINLNEPAYSWMRGMMERQGQAVPPDGIVTRQMFVDESTKRMAARNAGGAPGGTMTFSMSPNGPMPGGPMVMTMGPDGRMNINPGNGGSDRDRGMERLRDQDKDGDGRVSRDEADRQLLPNFDKIDADRDGYITLAEYRGWYATQNGGRNNNGPGGNNGWDPNTGGDMGSWANRMDPRRDTEEQKPVAMRYGHLPKDLPEWFDTDDLNKDGQIALFEWRKAGKSIAEFETMDMNGDGLITADELLRFNRSLADAQRIAAIMDGTSVRPSLASRGPGGKGPNGPNAGVTLPGASPDAISAERPNGKGANRDANGERPEKGPGKGPNRDANGERSEKGSGKGPNRDSGSDKAIDPGYDNTNNGADSKPNPFRKGKN